ncbi:MAG: hypothetical protein ACR2P2_02065 [Nakamurella sp.]
MQQQDETPAGEGRRGRHRVPPSALLTAARTDVRTALRNTSARQLAARQSYARWAIVVIALLVAVTGLFGGLKAAANAGEAPMKLGVAVTTPQWSVTVQRARLATADQLAPLHPLQPHTHWLGVVAEVMVTASTPQLVTGTGDSTPGVIEVSGVQGIQHPWADQVAIVQDASTSPELQPGVSEQIVFLWEQQDSAPVLASATVTVMSLSYIRSVSDDTLRWLNPAPYGHLAVAVQVEPNSSPTSTGGPGG